jgi:ABC-type glycerol-3-phosphate transport system substrate-binding protein
LSVDERSRSESDRDEAGTVSRNPKYPSKTSQDLIVELGPNTTPVLKSVLNSPRYLAGPPASMKIIYDQIPAYRDPETFIGWNKWRDSVVAALLPAFSGKSTVQEAAKEAARQGDLVLAAIPR